MGNTMWSDDVTRQFFVSLIGSTGDQIIGTTLETKPFLAHLGRNGKFGKNPAIMIEYGNVLSSMNIDPGIIEAAIPEGKRTKTLKIYNNGEIICLEDLEDMYCVCAGLEIKLKKNTVRKGENSTENRVRIVEILFPNHALVLTNLSLVDLGFYYTDKENNPFKFVPTLAFMDIELRPSFFSHKEYLQEAITELKENPDKKTKRIGINTATPLYPIANEGIHVFSSADREKCLLYPFKPKVDRLDAFWKVAQR